MSENDNCHCAVTTKVVIKSHGKECLKSKSLVASLENRHRGCERDMLGQTVRSMAAASCKDKSRQRTCLYLGVLVQLVSSEQQLEIESAAIEFFSSVISCHAKNQLTFALILCDVIQTQRNVIPGLLCVLILIYIYC